VSDVVVSTPPAISSPMTETSSSSLNAEPSTRRPATISLTASARGSSWRSRISSRMRWSMKARPAAPRIARSLPATAAKMS